MCVRTLILLERIKSWKLSCILASNLIVQSILKWELSVNKITDWIYREER